MHTLGSSGSHGHVQSALHTEPPQSEPGGSHCSLPLMARSPQSAGTGSVVVVVVVVPSGWVVVVVSGSVVVVVPASSQLAGAAAALAWKRPASSRTIVPPKCRHTRSVPLANEIAMLPWDSSSSVMPEARARTLIEPSAMRAVFTGELPSGASGLRNLYALPSNDHPTAGRMNVAASPLCGLRISRLAPVMVGSSSLAADGALRLASFPSSDSACLLPSRMDSWRPVAGTSA